MIDDDVLHARVPFVARTQQCFAIKAGIDGFLDVARRSFCDTSEGFDHNLTGLAVQIAAYFPFATLIPKLFSIEQRYITLPISTATNSRYQI